MNYGFVQVVGTATVTAGRFRRGEVDEQTVREVSEKLREELRRDCIGLKGSVLSFEGDSIVIDFDGDDPRLILRDCAGKLSFKLDNISPLGKEPAADEHLRLLDAAPDILHHVLPHIRPDAATITRPR